MKCGFDCACAAPRATPKMMTRTSTVRCMRFPCDCRYRPCKSQAADPHPRRRGCVSHRRWTTFLLPHAEHPKIDGFAHGEITRAVRVELVAWPTGRAFRNELGLHPAAGWIERRSIELRDRIEHAGRPDEGVEGAALVVLLLRVRIRN